jgi:hypothetical protein
MLSGTLLIEIRTKTSSGVMQMQSASGLLAHTIAQRSTKLTDFSDAAVVRQLGHYFRANFCGSGRGAALQAYPLPRRRARTPK